VYRQIGVEEFKYGVTGNPLFIGGIGRDLLLEFLDPLDISGTVQARNLKFGMNIDHEGTGDKN